MINCNNFNENICAYIDNELSIEERLSFEEHAKYCRECKRELDEMTRIVGLCTSLPQYELPDDFKAELHEKLLAVAGRQGNPVYTDNRDSRDIKESRESRERQEDKVRNIRKSKGFLFLKTFAAVAAGVLIIFLAGSYFKPGLFSPSRADNANSMKMTAEQPAAKNSEESAMISQGAAESEMGGAADSAGAAGTAADQATAFAAKSIEPAAALAGTAEVDRSAAIQNRDAVTAEAASMPETINSKIATITITTVDPGVQTEKVKLLALENSGEVVDKTLIVSYSMSMPASGQSESTQPNGSTADVQSGNTAASAQATDNKASLKTAGVLADGGSNASSLPIRLDFILPDTQYEQFISVLNTEYGAASVQSGALVTEDVTAALNSSIAESIDLDNRIQELQKEDSTKNAVEIDDLKAKKEATDKRIEELRLGSDLVNVTVYINGK